MPLLHDAFVHAVIDVRLTLSTLSVLTERCLFARAVIIILTSRREGGIRGGGGIEERGMGVGGFEGIILCKA